MTDTHCVNHGGTLGTCKALRAFNSDIEISRHRPHDAVSEHRHFAAYAAIVLDGEYTEISVDGKLDVSPGDIVVHPVFHRHTNVFAGSPVSVLNLNLPSSAAINLPYARMRLAELPCTKDDIVHQPQDCAAAIADAFQQVDSDDQARTDDDVVGFAWQQLKQPQAAKVCRVAAETGVSPEHLSREFRARHGMSPVEYRSEHRFRHALRSLVKGDTAADTACDSGYSDQSHMTRDIKRRTGMTPTHLAQYFAFNA